MRDGTIKIRGAAQNNLRGLDLDLPRNRLVAVTGVSGSGKSSLAFDTLFREGQRRFLETLSAYARQFLGELSKPAVESIEGLSPAIAVDQKTLSRGARSTVGTLTEIVDHLRVLFARAGRAHCPSCALPIRSQTPEAIVQQILREAGPGAASSAGSSARSSAGSDATPVLLVCAPVVRGRKGEHRAVLDDLRKRGFVRVRVDGLVHRIEEVPPLARYKVHAIEVVVDRLRVDEGSLSRLRDSVEQALVEGDGDLLVVGPPEVTGPEGARAYSTLRSCPGCGGDVPPLEPRLFSFNSPHGACPACDGLGVVRRPTEAALVADAALTIREGALAVTRKKGGSLGFPRVDFRYLEQVAAAHAFDLDTPWRELSAAARRVILHGAGDERFEDRSSWDGERFQGSVRWMRRFRGVIPAVERALAAGRRRREIQRFLAEAVCTACDGTRLNPAARAVRWGGRSFAEVVRTPIDGLDALFDGLVLEPREARISRDLLTEIRRRTAFLLQVGLDYLTLERAADTLSGGEAQRIRLAAQLGAGLQGVLYVLDEPSIGLHARDHDRLLDALRGLRDLGNSVVVVEHDEATLRAADLIVDIGPGAGRHGGRLVALGTPEEVARADSPTGRLLRGEVLLERPPERRTGSGNALVVRGARAFNLKGIDVAVPLGTLTVLSGVSGSGKSTLLDRILLRAVQRHLGREGPEPGEHESIEGLEHVDELVCVDASPIGRTPRSNPATYTRVFGPIRDLFASLPEARMRGYTKSRFSFNVEGGRCEECGGAGSQYVELQFLAPVTVTCPECGGRRFNAETLEVRYREHSIADVLALTAEDALALFADHPKIARPLGLMVEIGLGYLTLGQPSTTISGGEAQRLKLVTHLQKRPGSHTLYLLDEPTTGLHHEDVARLVAALQRLVERGHTVLVIEHDLDLVHAADWVIDLGPEGGGAGGELVVAGPPEEIERCERSHTGAALRARHAARQPRSAAERAAAMPAIEAPTRLTVIGARTHNLQNIDVDLPRDALTVITGPSGSGKSSLALDTIHTEGRRRFVESLSTYARQFLGTKDRPPVERIDGLGPSVAVEARTSVGHPRSTVATTTEVHDLLRVLWARAGTPHCPEHGERLTAADASRVARGLAKDLDGETGWILAPIFGPHLEEPTDPAAELVRRAESWRAAGFVRAMIEDREVRLDALDGVAVAPRARVDLVIDRLSFSPATRARVAEAVEQAEAVTGGRVRVRTRGGKVVDTSTRGACPICGYKLAERLEPRHFSFNTHVGACPACDGLGERVQCDSELLVSHPERALTDGAIGSKLGRYLTKGKGYYEHLLRAVARAHEIPLAKPVAELADAERALLLHGTGARKSYTVEIERSTRHAEVEERFTAEWPGLCGHVDAWHQKTEDPEWAAILERVMSRRPCKACAGERLAPGPRAVTVGRRRLPPLLAATVDLAREWLEKLKLAAAAREAVAPVTAELEARLGLLARVGLGYLTLDRKTATLSGGEARRVRLSASLGSQLVGVCYVLDEPTVGLHPRDVARLTDTLLELRDRGNTVLVVEHDLSLMRRADHLVDLGPGAGRHGGRVVASGKPAEVARVEGSATGRALRGELRLDRAELARSLAEAALRPASASRDADAEAQADGVADAEADLDGKIDGEIDGDNDGEIDGNREASAGAEPDELDAGADSAEAGFTVRPSPGDRLPRPGRARAGDALVLTGARTHNLKGVDLEVPFGRITGLCGPSGSGKSTLVLETLVPALRGERPDGRWRALRGAAGGGVRTVVVDASPVGRTPASLPATYTGLMEPLRELFARTPDARVRGFDASRFSFNSTKGRCPACEGKGATKVEMQFLADLWIPCEECDGRRYLPEVLEVRYRGKSIADVLDMEAGEALEFFAHQPKIAAVLAILAEVGLAYLRLGQSSTTLSGGEAQRLKLAAELLRAEGAGRCVLVLDEPSTGLHATDVVHLARVLVRLAERGNAVVLIEHHTELLGICDRLVELGPDGGEAGGRILAAGSPEELARDPASVTGPWLFGEPGTPDGAPPARDGPQSSGAGRGRRRRVRT